MPVHNPKADDYTRKMYVGMKVGKIEVIDVAPHSYTVQCICGEVIRKKSHQAVPSMCKDCARVTFRDHLVPATKASDGMALREYTAIEDIMLKEHTGKLTKAEKKILKEYRAEVTKS